MTKHSFHALTRIWALLASVLLIASGTAKAQNTGETPLRPGDKVKITITGVPAGDQQAMALQLYIVSNDGTIRLPHLKTETRAIGLTPTALARHIESTYKVARIYTNPAINISRSDDATSVQTVTVSGNVKVPGSAVFRPGMLINDAISEKGGPDDFANMKKVKLIRKGRSQEIDLSQISVRPERNVALEPGDTIMVPAARPFSLGR